MKTFNVINQARMTSTRLPGKVLKEVLGKPLFTYQIERLLRAHNVNNIVIATTVNREDDVLAQFCQDQKLDFYRGSELDVLDRYFQAHIQFPSSHIIRVTSDCPLHDPAILDLCVEQFLASGVDYFTNSDGYPNGMGVEIFTSEMLKEAHQKGKLPYEREHVTPYFYAHPQLFKLGQAKAPKIYPKYRLTVDTPEDFQLIKILLERLVPQKPNFSLDDICAEFDKDPSLESINSHIYQKKFTDV